MDKRSYVITDLTVNSNELKIGLFVYIDCHRFRGLGVVKELSIKKNHCYIKSVYQDKGIGFPITTYDFKTLKHVKHNG